MSDQISWAQGEMIIEQLRLANYLLQGVTVFLAGLLMFAIPAALRWRGR